MPTAKQILRELRQRGNPNTATIYRRHGVRAETVGVPYGELDKLAKRLGVDHELARGLWASGLHDARILACKIADPVAATRKEIDQWLGEVDNHGLSGALSGLAARTRCAGQHAKRWIKSKREWRASTGWGIVASVAVAGRLESDTARQLLARIEQGIGDAPNRVRHTMNGALIAIGGSMPELRARALEIAGAIGTVEVDHGETGCKTPDAAAYIARMVAHDRAKRRRNKATMARGAARRG